MKYLTPPVLAVVCGLSGYKTLYLVQKFVLFQARLIAFKHDCSGHIVVKYLPLNGSLNPLWINKGIQISWSMSLSAQT